MEDYRGIVNFRGFRITKEFQQMEKVIKNLKPNQSFVIRNEWKNYPHKIRREMGLSYVLRVVAIPDNSKFRRVVRVM